MSQKFTVTVEFTFNEPGMIRAGVKAIVTNSFSWLTRLGKAYFRIMECTEAPYGPQEPPKDFPLQKGKGGS